MRDTAAELLAEVVGKLDVAVEAAAGVRPALPAWLDLDPSSERLIAASSSSACRSASTEDGAEDGAEDWAAGRTGC